MVVHSQICGVRLSSSLPPIVSEGGGLVCQSVGKADLLSDHFDSKQSREAVDLPLTCHRSPSLATLAFRLSEVRRLLSDFDHYFVTDPLGMFPLFLKKTDVMALRLIQGIHYVNAHLCTNLRLSVKKNGHSASPDTL